MHILYFKIREFFHKLDRTFINTLWSKIALEHQNDQIKSGRVDRNSTDNASKSEAEGKTLDLIPTHTHSHTISTVDMRHDYMQ